MTRTVVDVIQGFNHESINEKRKWDEFIDDEDDDDGEGYTHRRKARELDERKEESIELAY